MKLKATLPVILALLIPFALAAQNHKSAGHGYVFAAPGGASSGGFTQSTFHLGGGGEAPVWGNLAVRAEIGSPPALRRTEATLRMAAPRWLTAGTLLHLARLHDVAGERKQAVKLYEEVTDDFEEEPEALAARIGTLNPYQPAQLARR